MPDDNDGSQASVQEAVSCQTDSLLENELMKSAWHDIDHWDIEDTDVRSRPVSPSSSGEMDSSLSMHAVCVLVVWFFVCYRVSLLALIETF